MLKENFFTKNLKVYQVTEGKPIGSSSVTRIFQQTQKIVANVRWWFLQARQAVDSVRRRRQAAGAEKRQPQGAFGRRVPAGSRLGAGRQGTWLQEKSRRRRRRPQLFLNTLENLQWPVWRHLLIVNCGRCFRPSRALIHLVHKRIVNSMIQWWETNRSLHDLAEIHRILRYTHFLLQRVWVDHMALEMNKVVKTFNAKWFCIKPGLGSKCETRWDEDRRGQRGQRGEGGARGWQGKCRERETRAQVLRCEWWRLVVRPYFKNGGRWVLLCSYYSFRFTQLKSRCYCSFAGLFRQAHGSASGRRGGYGALTGFPWRHYDVTTTAIGGAPGARGCRGKLIGSGWRHHGQRGGFALAFSFVPRLMDFCSAFCFVFRSESAGVAVAFAVDRLGVSVVVVLFFH